MLIGYARVSTQQQDTAMQKAAFKRYGVKKIIEEKRSGRAERPMLEKILRELRPGDTLCVYKMDRLARSLIDLLRILDTIDRVGANFKSLTEPLETETPIGRMMIQLLGAVAEFEREVIRERCQAGRVEAMANGVPFGRPSTLEREAVMKLKEKGLRQREIAEALGVSESAIYRVVTGVRVRDGGPGEHRLRCKA